MRGTKLLVSLFMLGLALSSNGMRSALAVPADGGYEANLLPADDGWVEQGSGFLGDYVTVAEGMMTYDGTVKAASAGFAMALAKTPRLGDEGTIEYRVRCRAIGGHPGDWYQFFITTSFANETYLVRDNLGHYQDYADQQIRTRFHGPRQDASVKPPTSSGKWDTNEWVTIRHIFKGAAEGKYHLESWTSGPGGDKKFIDATKERSGYPPLFQLELGSSKKQTCKGAIFDLDYIRWSSQVVPYGTPLEPASRAPAVASIHPRDGSPFGGTTVRIKGGGFEAKTRVKFGRAPAQAVKYTDEHTLQARSPGYKRGWVDVEVKNRNGKTTVKEAFFYGVLPTIKIITPKKGTNLGGKQLTIQGSGFQSGASVKLGQQESRKVRVLNGNTILCVTPAPMGRWSGPTDLIVTNPDGGYAAVRGLYTYERSSSVKPKALGWFIDLRNFNLPVAIQKLEEMPFPGVILRPLNWLKLGRGTFTQEMADENTAILKAVEFQRFKHNLMYVTLTGTNRPILRATGFFEDWTEVLASYGRYARMAKESGFRGIWLDVENYGGPGAPQLGGYGGYRDTGKSFAECERQIKLRAREMMGAMLSEFPEVKVITTFGLGAATNSYDLVPAFVDGMLEAVASDESYARAQVIDGYEGGYYITTADDYQRAYDRMRQPGGIAYKRTSQDQAWAEYGRAAFGLFPSTAYTLDLAKAQFISAMNRTDEYVWLFVYGSFFNYNNIPTMGGGSANNTDAYIQALVELTGLPRATPPGRYRTIGQWRMEEGKGDVTADLSGLGFNGSLSDAGIWTEDTPRLPRVAMNKSALDFRGRRHYVNIDRFGYHSRRGPDMRLGSSHLGNLYFTDHTLEFSFFWDGSVSGDAQYLYGADGGKGKEGKALTFGYGGFIPARTRTLVHWQRGNYGGEFGGVEIDLERARAAGAYRFGRWANVAIKVKSIHSKNWKIFLNGQDVTNKDWAGVYGAHETVGGFAALPQNSSSRVNVFLLDLALGARNADELGVIGHFNGMLDEFRITAGQVPARHLLSVP